MLQRLTRVLRTVLCAALLAASTQTARATDATERAGDQLQFIIPAIGLAATVWYEPGWDGTKQWLQTMIASQAASELLKNAVRERRPNGDCCKSFPSGHTTAAFAGAAFVHQRYGWKIAVPLYAEAAFVGYSRIESKKHYFGDVVAGAALGVGTATYFTKPYGSLQLFPLFGPHGGQLLGKLTF